MSVPLTTELAKKINDLISYELFSFRKSSKQVILIKIKKKYCDHGNFKMLFFIIFAKPILAH